MPLSRKLWLELQTPPDPRWRFLIFDRMMNRNTWTPWAYLSVVVVILTLGTIAFMSGTLWGAFTAYRTASSLLRERRRNTFDVLALTLLGEAGIGWKAFEVAVHYDIELPNFLALRKLTLAIVRFPLYLLLPITILLLLTQGMTVLQQWYVELLLVWITVAAMMYVDPIYGLIAGGLVGIIANHTIRGDTPFFAAMILVALQVAGYLLMFLVGIIVYYVAHSWSNWLVLTLPVFSLGAYVALRELTIWALWRFIQRQFSA